jgi:hypothetical protein
VHWAKTPDTHRGGVIGDGCVFCGSWQFCRDDAVE